MRDNNEASWTQVLDVMEFMSDARITSYNVCYTKLLRYFAGSCYKLICAPLSFLFSNVLKALAEKCFVSAYWS